MNSAPHDPALVEAMRDALAEGSCHGPCPADEPCLCRLDAEAALTALCAARPDVAAVLAGEAVLAQGWRTMDSAPRDGTPVLLAVRGRVVRGEWCCGYWRNSEEVPLAEPTHWMPLPAPPAGGEP